MSKEYRPEYYQANKERIKAQRHRRSLVQRQYTNAPEMRRCRKCHETKKLDDFSKGKEYKFGRRYICKKCFNNYNLNRLQDPKLRYIRRLSVMRHDVKKAYGITLEEYLALKIKYKKCAICGREGRLHLDHDHKDGNIRGILCRACNHGLGNFCDNPSLLRKAAKYIER